MNNQPNTISRPTAILIFIIIILIIVVAGYFVLKNNQKNINIVNTNVSSNKSVSKISLAPPLVAYINDGNIWIANTKGNNRRLTTDRKTTALFGWSSDNKKVIYGVDLNESQEVDERVLNRTILINEVSLDTNTVQRIAEEKGLAKVYYLSKLNKYILQDSVFTFWLVDYNRNTKDKIDEMANPIYDGGPGYDLLTSGRGDKIVYWQKTSSQLRLFDINNLKIETLLEAENNNISYTPLGWGKDEKSLFFREFEVEQAVGSYIIDLTSKEIMPLFNQDFFSLGNIHYNPLIDTYVFNGNLKSNQYSIVPPVFSSPGDLKSYKEVIGTSEDVLWISGTKNLSYLEPIDPLFSYRIWISDEYGKNHLLMADNLRYSDFHYLPVWTN